MATFNVGISEEAYNKIKALATSNGEYLKTVASKMIMSYKPQIHTSFHGAVNLGVPKGQILKIGAYLENEDKASYRLFCHVDDKVLPMVEGKIYFNYIGELLKEVDIDT